MNGVQQSVEPGYMLPPGVTKPSSEPLLPSDLSREVRTPCLPFKPEQIFPHRWQLQPHDQQIPTVEDRSSSGFAMWGN